MFFANAMSSLSSVAAAAAAATATTPVGARLMTKTKSQQHVVFDVFKEHWRQVLCIFNKSLVNDDDIQIVKSNLGQMMALLIDELNQVTNAALVSNGGGDDEVILVGAAVAPAAAATDETLQSQPQSQPGKFSGPLWDYLLATNILETVYLWSLSYPEYLYDLKYEQLRNYEELIAQMQTNEQTNLLLYRQLHRPLFSLLNHCATHNSELIERYMISILNQLCVCMCKNASLLNIFFDYATSTTNGGGGGSGGANMDASDDPSMYPFNQAASLLSSNELILERSPNEKFARSGHAHSKSFIFTLLIPYIHKEGSLGQQARDALLMIMQLSSRNQNLAKYIVYSTDFCPILATGLSGLYSELPQKLCQHANFDEIRYLQKEDIIRIHSLNKFINSLEFCNNVIQVSHSLIANQLLQYVYYGFLVPVIAPALTQDVADKFPVELIQLENYTNCMDEIVSATLYLDLFLRTINEPNLLRIFLKFILFSKFDERMTLLDTLINRINSSTKLSLATLMLFHTMIDLNSEDVIYKLILTYLMPCKHLMKSQLVTLKQSSCETNGLNAQAFLALSSEFITTVSNSESNSSQTTTTSESGFNNVSSSSTSTSSSSSPHHLVVTSYSSLNESSPVYRWLNTFMDGAELDATLHYLESIRFNYVDYLRDAKAGIQSTTNKTVPKWSSRYDDVGLSKLNENHVEDADNDDCVMVAVDDTTSGLRSSSSNTTTTLSTKATTPLPVATTASTSAVVVAVAADLDADVEEFFFHLNLASTEQTFVDATKSARSTTNIVRQLGDDTSDSVLAATDYYYYDDMNVAVESNGRTPKAKRSHKKRSGTDVIVDKSTTTKTNNDFYILSFDNEISESSDDDDDNENANNNNNDDDDDVESSHSSSSSTYNDDPNTTTNNKNNNDGTDTSVSSQTVNNEPNDEVATTATSNGGLDRQHLVDYLFVNEDNNKTYLNSNLNNFLTGLENYFSTNQTELAESEERKISPHKSKKKSKYLDHVCNDITRLYEDLIGSSQATAAPSATTTSALGSGTMTQFPSYIDDSANTTAQTVSSRLVTNTVDSGVEQPSLQEDLLLVALGPFLCALFDRLEHMLSNSLQINFLVTGIVTRLAYYPQLLLRSFLLNNALVLQPNVKSLVQVLGNVKYKLDVCARTYNNFSLLYLRAKMSLVKRLVENPRLVLLKQQQTNMRLLNASSSLSSPNNSTASNSSNSSKQKNTKFTVDRILSIFFKPDGGLASNRPNGGVTTSRQQYNYQNGDLAASVVELDLDDAKTKYIKSGGKTTTVMSSNDSLYEISSGTVNIDDFLIADTEWEDVRTRNIAFSAVIFDEFVKELAAICQEHSVLSNDV